MNSVIFSLYLCLVNDLTDYRLQVIETDQELSFFAARVKHLWGISKALHNLRHFFTNRRLLSRLIDAWTFYILRRRVSGKAQPVRAFFNHFNFTLHSTLTNFAINSHCLSFSKLCLVLFHSFLWKNWAIYSLKDMRSLILCHLLLCLVFFLCI